MVRQAAATTKGLHFRLHVRRICGGIACAAALMPQTLAAQDIPKERKKAPPAGIGAAPAKKATRSDDEPRLLDRVMMTVDNRVILLSEVEETYIATLTSRMRGGMKFDARLRMRLFQQVPRADPTDRRIRAGAQAAGADQAVRQREQPSASGAGLGMGGQFPVHP